MNSLKLFNRFDNNWLEDTFFDFPSFLSRPINCDIVREVIGDKETKYKINLAGFKKSEIKVYLKDFGWTIKVVAESKEQGKYNHQFTLPFCATDGVSAKFDDGLLVISVENTQKSEEKQIQVA